MPLVSAELEFYLSDNLDSFPELEERIVRRCPIDGGIEREAGRNQYEVQFPITAEPKQLALQINMTRDAITELAEESGLQADFSARPHDDQAGSGMHIHVCLTTEEGVFPMMRQQGNDEESDVMLYALGGLIQAMPDSMNVFSPNEAAFSRYQLEPTTPCAIGWGGGYNRTVALRIPPCVADPQNRRIEHRAPAAEAEPDAVLIEILNAIANGIEQKRFPQTPKTHGNAWDDQYHLVRLIDCESTGQ